MLLVFFIFSGMVNAQEFDPEYLEYHNKFVPPTPNASTFTIYGDVPVSHATGLPQINIPLFTLEEDGVKIPISLSYHASGVKVDDLSSVVGLKWTLNAGGGIFRQVNDKIDEEGWLNPNKRGIVNPTWLDAQGPLTDDEVQNAMNSSAENHDYYPDDFTYNFLGYSGNFIFNTQGQVEDEYSSTMKIIKVTNGPLSFNFVGQDGRGNTYYFDTDYETNRKNVISGSPQTGNLNFDSDVLKTGWMLNEIVTRNNYTINFTYAPYDLEYISDNVSYTIAHAPGCGPSGSLYQCGCLGDASGDVTDVSNTDIYYYTRNQLISTIESQDVRITFNYATDVTLSTWQRKLTSIVILDKIGNKSKSFNFVYGKFSGDPRLRLDEIQEVGFDGSTKPPFSFSYISGNLPDKGDLGKDFFGYYNGKNNTSLVPFSTTAYNALNTNYRNFLANRFESLSHLKIGTLDKITYPTGGSSEFIYEANAVPESTNINIPYRTYSTSVSTQASTYVATSGAYTMFRTPFTIYEDLLGNQGTTVNYNGSSDICPYDPNSPNIDCSRFNIYPRSGTQISGAPIFNPDKIVWADGSVNLLSGDYMLELIVETSELNSNPNALIQMGLDWVNPDDGIDPTRYLGGLRVKSVLDKDSDGTLVKRTSYTYEDLIGQSVDVSNTIKGFGAKAVFSSENQTLHPSIIRNGYFYGKVTIDKLGPLGSSDIIRTVEFYEDTFRNKKMEPQIIRQEFYQGTELVKSTDYEYTNSIQNTDQFWVLGFKDLCFLKSGKEVLGYNQPISQNYYHRRNVLSKRTEIDYLHEEGDPFACTVKIRKFQYNDDLLPTRDELDGRYYALSQQDVDNDNLSLASEGEHIIVELTYPEDHAGDEAILNTMNNNHLFNFPVSKKVYNHNTLILGQFMEYDSGGNVLATYKYNKGSGTNSSSSGHIPSNYELESEFTLQNGRPVEVKRADGPTTSFLWDSSYKYLLAKLINVTKTELDNELNGSIIPDINSVSNLNALYNSLRTAFPKGHIKTFVYDPLRGVKQIGDTRDDRTNFFFDGMGRLQEIRDKDNKLLSSYDYHYINQNN